MKKTPEHIDKKGSAFVAVASILWSLDGLLRRSLYTLPPSIVVFYEHLMGFAVLLFAGKTWIPEVKKLNKKGWIAISIVALFSGALGTIFYTAALGQVNYIQYSVVVLLQQLQPVWAVTAAVILLQEKISKRFIIFAITALFSAYIIAFPDLTLQTAEGNGTLIAALFALLAGLLWGSATAVSKYVLLQISFLSATALRFLLTPIFAFIIILFMGQNDMLFSINQQQLMTLLLITFSTGMVALGIYYFGLKRIPAHVSTIIELLFPLSAIIIDFVYFQKPLTPTQLVGSGLLLFCIYQISRLTISKK